MDVSVFFWLQLSFLTAKVIIVQYNRTYNRALSLSVQILNKT